MKMGFKDIRATRLELKKALKNMDITAKSKKHIVNSLINMKRGKVFKLDMTGLEGLK
jgi:hypothetical protein